MTINRYNKISVVFLLLFLSCGQKKKSTIFKEDKLFDDYLLKIPSVLVKEGEGKWQTPESDHNLLLLEINSSMKGERSLQEHLDGFINEDNRKFYQGKSIVNKETLSFNGFSGIAVNYDKDNSTGIYPVMTYYTFAVLQEGNIIIRIRSASMGVNYTADIMTTIKSIKKNRSDSLKINLSNVSQKEISKFDLKKLKHEGYQIFENDNFLIKCNCTLKLNKAAIETAKEQGSKYPFISYTCSANENSYESGSICNINIIDMTSDYASLQENQYDYFTNQFLKSYSKEMIANNVSCTEGEFNGLKTVEYSFLQMEELPTKAIFFVKDKKSYLLQIGTRKNIVKTFNDLKASFKFIN